MAPAALQPFVSHRRLREASETIARQVRNALRETVSARRIQGGAVGGWTEKGIDQILFRGSHDIMRPLASYPSSVVHALMPSVVRFMLQAFLEIDATEAAVAGGEGWLPTAANVNALPEGIRRYVHDLETRCDPAGDVQKMALPGGHHPRTRREGAGVGGRACFGAAGGREKTMTSRAASLLIGLWFLAVAKSASAECAWVLWQELPVASRGWSLDTGRESAFPTKKACEKRLRERIQAFAQATTGEKPFLVCLPDTVDPRGPKGK
jgi:hypothetical protein